MARRKPNPSRSRSIARDLFLRLIIAAVAVFAAGLIFVLAGRQIKRLDFFRIKDIVVNGAQNVDLSYLEGRNIFSFEINKESLELWLAYPDFKSVRLVRVLPNRLFVYFTRRQPVASVKLYRYFYVDRDAVLFDLPAEESPGGVELPVILGLETRLFGPKSGKKYNIKELNLSLEIIDEFRRSRALKVYKIAAVNVSNAAGAFFSLVGPDFPALQVKIGQEDIPDRMAILASLLGEEGKNLAKIKYIDLRFKEPVIKYNDAK